MRKIFLVATLCFFCSICFSQYQAPAYFKGQSTISAAHGIINFWKRLFDFTVPDPDASYKVSSTGPYSLFYEYGFSNRISAGIALGYTSIKGVLKYQTYRNDEKFTNFAILARGSYHFGKIKNFDPYVGVGAGYYKFDYSSKDNSGSVTPGTGVKVPGAFGYSGLLGGRYYFNPNIAAMVEVGYVAGSYIQAGITARF
jgi:outer membrane protein W